MFDSKIHQAKDWVKVLAMYRDPSALRSSWVVTNTLAPFIGIWALAWLALDVGYIGASLLSVPIGLLLMRAFCLQHDCGHNALFRSKLANDWVGRGLSVITITPFGVWKVMHNAHHASNGNLDVRDIGEVRTLTVEEYLDAPILKKVCYRVYRHPFFLFGLAPFLLFFVQHRLPVGLWNRPTCWYSAMALNAVLVVLLGTIWFFGGWAPILLIFIPSVLIGATAGVFTFYVQHQFENAYWERETNWQVHEAALRGSTHVVLPRWLAWFTANIGIHHVHHLYARIPFYRLPEVLRDHPELGAVNRVSFRESLRSVHFHLWDENNKRMVSFSDVGATSSSLEQHQEGVRL